MDNTCVDGELIKCWTNYSFTVGKPQLMPRFMVVVMLGPHDYFIAGIPQTASDVHHFSVHFTDNVELTTVRYVEEQKQMYILKNITRKQYSYKTTTK